MAAKAARDARRQAEKEATDTCNSHERVPGRRLSVFAKRKVHAPKAATMPAPPTDDVVRGDENGEGRAEARQGRSWVGGWMKKSRRRVGVGQKLELGRCRIKAGARQTYTCVHSRKRRETF